MYFDRRGVAWLTGNDNIDDHRLFHYPSYFSSLIITEGDILYSILLEVKICISSPLLTLG